MIIYQDLCDTVGLIGFQSAKLFVATQQNCIIENRAVFTHFGQYRLFEEGFLYIQHDLIPTHFSHNITDIVLLGWFSIFKQKKHGYVESKTKIVMR
jgi:hypothetical protein